MSIITPENPDGKVKSVDRYCVQCGSKLYNATMGESLFKFCKTNTCPNFALFQVGFELDIAKKVFPNIFNPPKHEEK